jgi:hypothetical protein
MAEFLERAPNISYLVRSNTWKEIDISPYIDMGYIPSSATGLILSIRSYGSGTYGVRPGGSCRILTGTATGGATNKLIDTTKNFVTLGIIPASPPPPAGVTPHEIHRDADGKWARIESISTTTNPNDTLNYYAGSYAPTFSAGDTYYVTFNFKNRINNSTGEMFYVGMNEDKKIEVYYDAGGYSALIEIVGYFDCEAVMFDGVPSGLTPFTKFTTSGGDGWKTFDLSLYVTSIAKGAIFLRCSDNSSSPPYYPLFGARKYGSTYDHKAYGNAITGFIVGLDGNKRCQVYHSTVKAQDFYLVGFLVTGVFKDTPEQIFPMALITSGIATGGSNTTLIDTTKNFQTIGIGAAVIYKLSDGKYVVGPSASTTIATQLVSGTATGMPAMGPVDRLVDTTKNFAALGVLPGHFVINTGFAYQYYAQVTSIDTTTNPNDTLRYNVSITNWPLSPWFGNGSSYQVWSGNRYDTLTFSATGTTPVFAPGDAYEIRRYAQNVSNNTNVDRISDSELPDYPRGAICHVFNDVNPASPLGGSVFQEPQGTYTVDHALGTNGHIYSCTKPHVSSPATRPITGSNWSLYWSDQGLPITNYGTEEKTWDWIDDYHYECWKSEPRFGEIYSGHGSSVLASGMRTTKGRTAWQYGAGDRYCSFVDAYGDQYFNAYDDGRIFKIPNYAGVPWQTGEQELLTVLLKEYDDDFYPLQVRTGYAATGSNNIRLIKGALEPAFPAACVGKWIIRKSDGKMAKIGKVASTYSSNDTVYFYERNGQLSWPDSPVFDTADEYEIKGFDSSHYQGMCDDINEPDGFFVKSIYTYNMPYWAFVAWTQYTYYIVGTYIYNGTAVYKALNTHVSTNNFNNDYTAGHWASGATFGNTLYRVKKDGSGWDIWHHGYPLEQEGGGPAFHVVRDTVVVWSGWTNWPSGSPRAGFVGFTRGYLGTFPAWHNFEVWDKPDWGTEEGLPAGGYHGNLGIFADGRMTLNNFSYHYWVMWDGWGNIGGDGHFVQKVYCYAYDHYGEASSPDNAANKMMILVGSYYGLLMLHWDIAPNKLYYYESDIATLGWRMGSINVNDRHVYQTMAQWHSRMNWDTGRDEVWDGDSGSYGHLGTGGTYFLPESRRHIFQGYNSNPDLKFYVMGYFEPCMIPGPASNPDPFIGETCVPVDKILSWDTGIYATSHNVYFGTSYPPPPVGNQIPDTYNPGGMLYDTVYYWRIDEVNIYGTTIGPDWNFRTAVQPPAKASNPDPFDEEANVLPTHILSWTSSPEAIHHRVHFGTTSPPPFIGIQSGTTYDPGVMEYSTIISGIDHPSYYYWHIDEVDVCDTTTAGDEWSFLIKYEFFEDFLIDATAYVELEEIYFKNEIIFSFDNTPVLIDTYVNLSIRGKQLSGTPNTFPVMIAIKLCDEWVILQPSYVCDFFVLTPTYFTFPSTWNTLYWEHIFSSKLTRAQINGAKIAIIPKDDLILHGVAISEIKLFAIEPAHEVFNITLTGRSTHNEQHDSMTKYSDPDPGVGYVKVYKRDIGGYGAGIFGFGIYGT